MHLGQKIYWTVYVADFNWTIKQKTIKLTYVKIISYFIYYEVPS